ncbi:MAG: single-stranded DNA-binding protein [Aquificaceae bacterium]|nr:single-stranded DNA-binding protein [Aquificaceae bacterium]MDW8237386.1 single-stranded DNA-binding protein [Aquificaceae bacterium]
MLNRVLLIGRIVKDAEVVTTNIGGKILNFSVAYNRNYQVNGEWKKEAHYFDVRAYGALANEKVDKLTRGTLVYVEGRLVQERWADKSGLQKSKVRIVADNIRILCGNTKSPDVGDSDTGDITNEIDFNNDS